MHGPEEWSSRRSNPADKIRLIGPAATKFSLPLAFKDKLTKSSSGAHNVRTQPPARNSPAPYPQREDPAVAQTSLSRQSRLRSRASHRQTTQDGHCLARSAFTEIEGILK